MKKALLAPFAFLADIFNEPGSSKASFGRVAGAVVITLILLMGWRGKVIPEAFMTMFWVLIGYNLVSKVVGPGGLAQLMGRGLLVPPTPVATEVAKP